MDSESKWEGQGFTLAIFVCVVGLCAVFFVLGMLAGRTGGPEAAEMVEIEPESLTGAGGVDAEPEDPGFTFFESVSGDGIPGDEPEPDSALPLPEPPAADPAPSPEDIRPPVSTPPVVASESAITLQVGALANADQAERLSQELVEKGFSAFVLRPDPSDETPYNRVQVGPFMDPAEAARVRAALEDEGYPTIVVR